MWMSFIKREWFTIAQLTNVGHNGNQKSLRRRKEGEKERKEGKEQASKEGKDPLPCF